MSADTQIANLPPPLADKRLVVHPTWTGAFRGIWLLTWQSNLTLRRLPALAFSLLLVPLLAYFTISDCSSTFSVRDLSDASSFASRLKDPPDAVSTYLRERLSPSTRQGLARWQAPGDPSSSLQEALTGDINAIVNGTSIWDKARFSSVTIRPETRSALGRNPRGADLARLNRLLLEDAYPMELSRNLNGQDSQPYLRWTIDFYLMLLLPLYCLFVCGALIRDELQGDTLGFLITRPLTRARLFLIKYFCHIIWLEGIAAVNGLLLILAGTLRHVPDLHAFPWILLGTQFLAVLVYGALSALFGLIHQRYMVLGIIYGFVVELGIGRIPTNINSLSMSHHVQTILANTKVVSELYSWPAKGWLASIGIMCLATLVFLGASSVLFTFKEYHHSEEMQK
jgi:ABC-type transport system involved in multi-copper enzyme maturation permease subunit